MMNVIVNIRRWNFVVMAMMIIVTIPNLLRAQELFPMKIFTSEGKEVAWKRISKRAKEADAILFGEIHNNALCHWVELALLKELHRAYGDKMSVGMEMLEADDSLILAEYLSGVIKESYFEQGANLWKNYATDYKPIVNYCKSNGIAVAATNVPRRYAGFVAYQGLDSLAKRYGKTPAYMPPLPIPLDTGLSTYESMNGMMGGSHGYSSNKMIQAQALKDARMAHGIASLLDADLKCLHFHGAYHSLKREGIAYFLSKYAPEAKILVITTVEQETVDKLEEEHYGDGDFIIAFPSDMAKTY